jgi:glycine cleavage system pyridoxal-binding protein P
MACRVTKRTSALVSGNVHPHYRDTTETTMKFLDVAVECLAPDPAGIEDLIGRITPEHACVVVQTPGFFGHLKNYAVLAEACHKAGALLVVTGVFVAADVATAALVGAAALLALALPATGFAALVAIKDSIK